jgi:hypothetical protein
VFNNCPIGNALPEMVGRFFVSSFGFQVSSFRFQVSSFKFQVSRFGFWNTDLRN